MVNVPFADVAPAHAGGELSFEMSHQASQRIAHERFPTATGLLSFERIAHQGGDADFETALGDLTDGADLALRGVFALP